jgi:hypothetical protein
MKIINNSIKDSIFKIRKTHSEIDEVNNALIQKLSELDGVKAFVDLVRDKKVFVFPLAPFFTNRSYPEKGYSIKTCWLIKIM